MDKMVEQAADRAVFQLQLNMSDAINYVAKHANISFGQAARAVNNAVIFHKLTKVD